MYTCLCISVLVCMCICGVCGVYVLSMCVYMCVLVVYMCIPVNRSICAYVCTHTCVCTYNNNNNDFLCANILEDQAQWSDKTKGLSNCINIEQCVSR